MFGPDERPEKVPSAGLVRDYKSVRIVSEDPDPDHGAERVLPPGEVGEICLRPVEQGSVMLGYYKMAEATAAAHTGGWFHTGDRGYLDPDGYLYFADRKKEAIRRRGENISAYEVEMVLCRHPHIVEAAAVPVPSELGEDDVMAYLVAAPGAELSFREVIEFARENMAYYMCRATWRSLTRCRRRPARRSRSTSSRWTRRPGATSSGTGTRPASPSTGTPAQRRTVLPPRAVKVPR